MARIEGITAKACSVVSEGEKQHKKADAFKRCLTFHIHLMTYELQRVLCRVLNLSGVDRDSNDILW